MMSLGPKTFMQHRCYFFLKPWKEMEDIDSGQTSLYKQFLSFESGTSNRYHNIIKNLQYFYECSDSATKWRKEGKETVIVSIDDDKGEIGNQITIVNHPHVYTNKDLEAALEPKCTQEEKLYTKIGMRIMEYFTKSYLCAFQNQCQSWQNRRILHVIWNWSRL